MSNILEDPTYNLYKKAYDSLTIYGYREFFTDNQNNELILLTPKCFKLMAMQSRTKKSYQVREYYYDLENALDQYKEYIIQGLQEKIEKIENIQKSKNK